MGDAQDIVLDKGGASGIPSGVATGLEGGAQAAVGEAGGIGLALDEVLARKLGNGGAVVVGLQEAVVLLGSNARKRLEPVRVVRRALEMAQTFMAWATALATSRSSGSPPSRVAARRFQMSLGR